MRTKFLVEPGLELRSLTPSNLPSTAQLGMRQWASKESGMLAILSYYPHYPGDLISVELGELHFSLNPSTDVLCAILESKDCFCL